MKIIKGSDFIFESVELMDYKLHRVRLRRGGSYIKSLKWLLYKKTTINPKNKNDDECLRWSTISALNYNEIMKKEFENIFQKLNMKIKIFYHRKETGKNLNKIMNQLLLMSYSEEITLSYKSEHNYNRENSALLLMINDDEKYYYFDVKSKLELCSSEWLRSKKQSITNGDSCLQDALDY